MLVNLHVKNLALIEEENIDFDEGLNILSGETGAGKSIILGSINAALGSKTSPDFIRSGCEYGLSEITFPIPIAQPALISMNPSLLPNFSLSIVL